MKDNCFTILCWFSAIHQHEIQTQRTDLLGFLNSLLSIFFLLPFSSNYIYIFDALTPGVLLIMERLPSQGQPIFRNSTGLQVLPSNANQEIQAHNFNFLCYRDLILQIIIFFPNHLRAASRLLQTYPLQSLKLLKLANPIPAHLALSFFSPTETTIIVPLGNCE